MCTEQGHWDTSKALVRRTIERCIQMGRKNRVSGDKHDEYEAFRLLGQAVRYFTPMKSRFTELREKKTASHPRRFLSPFQLL